MRCDRIAARFASRHEETMAAVFALLLLIATAQTFPPGYVDPEPILEAAGRPLASMLCDAS
jgi:hypothetical protein